MAEFLRFISPDDMGPMPLEELLSDSQHEVRQAMVDVIDDLPKTEDPQLLRMLFALDDGREVAHSYLRNCDNLDAYYEWKREQQAPQTAFKFGHFLMLGMDGLAKAHGYGVHRKPEENPED